MEKRSISRMVRDFLFSTANREFLIFLFFLALSGVFWLMMTLNETYEREIAMPFRITNVPKDIVLTSEETDTIKMTMRDKGLILFGYLFGEDIQPVSVNFKTYDKGSGTGIVSSQELIRLAARQLSTSTKINAVNPSKLEFFYNSGTHKRVPVRWTGRVIPEQLYFLSHEKYSPDSVTVYAREEQLDSIRTVYTEPLNCVGFRDSLTVECRIRRTQGVKTIPDMIRVTFYTDVLTEESMDSISVIGINMPPGKVLRTFPAKVRVKFVAGVSVYRNLKASDFQVIADYNELRLSPLEKCNIYLKSVPEGVSRAVLEVKQVDYLIEEESIAPKQ